MGKITDTIADLIAPIIIFNLIIGSFSPILAASDLSGLSQDKSDIVVSLAPSVPYIYGPTSGLTKVQYNYMVHVVDLYEQGEIAFTVDWGDGTNVTTALVNSSPQSLSHNWTSSGSYLIRAMAINSGGESSNWSDPRTMTVHPAGWEGLGGIVNSNPYQRAENVSPEPHIFVKGGDEALWDNVDGAWQSLGGVITSDPSAIAEWGWPSTTHIFVLGADNALWDRILDGDWVYLGGQITSKPSAAISGDGHVKVAVKGADNALWLKDISTGNWTPLAGIISSNPAAIFDNRQGKMHILVRGTDNALWDNIDGSWISLGGVITSDPIPLYNWTNGNIHTFVVGSDDALWRNDLNTCSNESTWHNLGGIIAANGGSIDQGNPSPAWDKNGVKHVFVQGADGALWDNADGVWLSLGGLLKSSPNAAYKGEWIEVAAVGGDDALWVYRMAADWLPCV